jgi:hypothetical protein
VAGHQREEEGGWRTLHNEELHNLYASPNIFRMIKGRRMRWAGHVAYMAEIRSTFNILVGKPEGKRPLGRSRYRWANNIRLDLSEIRWEGVDWIHVAQDRNQWRAVVNTVMNLKVSYKAGNLTKLVTISFSRRILLTGVSYLSKTSGQLYRNEMCFESTQKFSGNGADPVQGLLRNV